MPTNIAAWLNAKATPFEINSAPYTSPSENEIVIKNGAVSVSLIDWVIQAMGTDVFPWLKLPTILGGDCAGTVVEVGSSVSRFKIGDRVVGHALGIANKDDPVNAAEGAFQHYTVLKSHMAALIPDRLSFEQAAVLPLGLSTAACALFQKDHLSLQYPTIPPKPTGETLLVWGGATSVGSNAIQLAVAAGYEVFATASPKNFEYVRKLGAAQAFDYHSRTVVADLIAAFQGKKCAGGFSIGTESAEQCLEIVDKAEGVKFVSMANPVPEKLPEGMGAKMVFGSDLWKNEVGKKVYVDFLGQALEKGTYFAAPDAQVVGKGLECIEEAFLLGKKGVSAKKLVVSL